MKIKAWARNQLGFTIVELLIVIVVVGILAAITVVAYSAVQTRAEYARVQSQVRIIADKVQAFNIEYDTYPSSITDCPTPLVTNLCLSVGSDVDISYSAIPQGGSGYMIANIPSYELAIFSNRQFVYHSPAEQTSSNEFMQYVDLGPIIDRYGLRPYQLNFDIKSANTTSASTARVYFQNGSTARYGGLMQTIPVTTRFTSHQVTFTPTLNNSSVSESMLAFYGTYSTGNILTVKNLIVKLAQ